MLGDSKSALVAVLLAYCAMAAPVPAGEHGYVLQVVGALRAKMDLDAPDPELSIILKETENALASNGTIHGETLDRLDHNIEILHKEHGLSIDEISDHVSAALSSGPSPQKLDEGQAVNGTVVLDHEAVKGVLGRGLDLNRRGGDCPDGSHAKLCCVIL